MNMSAIEKLAVALEQASATTSPVAREAVSQTVNDLPAAYALSDLLAQRAQARGRKQIGWKIGLTSEPALKAFGAREPMVGRLYAETGLDENACLSLAETIAPRLEGEIMLELAGPCAPDADDASLLASIARVYPSFEIADSRIKDWPLAVAPAAGDNACCGWHLRGIGGVLPHDVDLCNARMVMARDGETIVVGNVADNIGSVLDIYRWFLTDSAARGRTLSAGEIILTGALGAPFPLDRAGLYQASIDGLPPVSLKVSQ